MKKRLEELLRHDQNTELLKQQAIVVAELKKIDDDFKRWQREQKAWRKKYPPITHSTSEHHDVDEGSRAEHDCCGL